MAQNLVPWGTTMQNLGSLACSVWAVGGAVVRKCCCTSYIRRKLVLSDKGHYVLALNALKAIPTPRKPRRLLSDKGHCVLALHAGFHEGEGDEDGSAAQAGDAVDRHAAAGRLGEARLEQIAPILDNLRRRRHPVVERPVLS